ncbi:hypothetical protein ZWY2020_002148 [Hordeum vulgare]|uniref:Peptidase M48 domain-containing protein n=1 Tax=Hordeum vulgare subsp. vulgare TaxID=112509 RepID=A0A8I6YQC8_HORVV|nr:hypothetical protein ZWY2020_002148 [Hordeum vulgare]
MNSCRNARSLLSQILLRCKAPGTRCYRSHAAPARVVQDLGSVRGSGSLPYVKPAARRASTSSRTTAATHFAHRWYHEPRKVAAATAITMGATVMAVCSLYDREIVPCTNRSHLTVLSIQEERDFAESLLAEEKVTHEVLDSRDPDAVRVRLIADRILHAARRGLGIYDCQDAPMLRVTEKRRKWRKAWTPRPQTSHLRDLNLEVILTRDGNLKFRSTASGKIMVTTGLLDCFKTDDEIAVIMAHEVGHIIARHQAEMTRSEWIPMFLWLFFSRRRELEADYIGILLLSAAGFHPQWALVAIQKLVRVREDTQSRHPKSEKRLELLSQAKVMEKALELYREATALDEITNRYFQ